MNHIILSYIYNLLGMPSYTMRSSYIYTCYLRLPEAIRSEIASLSGDALPCVSDVASVAELARARQLHLEGDLSTENLAETVFRTQLLGELLVDLQEIEVDLYRV